MVRFLLLLWVLAGLATGTALSVLGHGDPAAWAWSAAALPVAVHVAVGVAGAHAGGRLGVDIIALAAIVAAVLLGEAAAAAVIALMVAGGEALEAWAEGRAVRSPPPLRSCAPRRAARLGDGGIEEIVDEANRPRNLLVLPARPYKPRGKAKVEVGVQMVQRWILARMRNQKFFSLAELNGAFHALVAQLNDRPMRALGIIGKHQHGKRLLESFQQ